MSQDNHHQKYILTPSSSNQQIIECMHIHNSTDNILHSCSIVKQYDEDYNNFYSHIMNIQDLSCRLNINNKNKLLLKNINISICSNEMIALLAPSGAGKSTLLDILADRRLDGVCTGSILVDGLPRSPLFKKEVAYVMQDDIHISTLTVEETLMYAAWTRLDEGTSLEARKQRVDELLESMDMIEIRSSVVGGPAAVSAAAVSGGISGGERKRLSIAVEMISRSKRFIFLDEPTSGLDSSTAYDVMLSIRRLVSISSHGGRCCITAIHQPAKEVFALFDKVVLLCNGRLVFFGTIQQGIEHFNSTAFSGGYGYNDLTTNPAEFFIDVVCGRRFLDRAVLTSLASREGSEAAYNDIIPKTTEQLVALYKGSRYYHHIALNNRPCDQVPTSHSAHDHYDLYATTTITQLKMLFHRDWTSKLRNVSALRLKIGMSIAIGFITGVPFFGHGHVEEPLYHDGSVTTEVRSLNSLMYFVIFVVALINVTAIASLSTMNRLYQLESSAYAYRPFGYWLCILLSDLPLQLLSHLIFISILYVMVNFDHYPDYFMYLYLSTFVVHFVSYSSALFLSASIPTVLLATRAFVFQFVFLNVFSGYLICQEDLINVWSWVPYLMFTRWGFEGLMINQWEHYDAARAKEDDDHHGDVLEDYGFNHFSKYICITINLLIMSVYMLLLYMFLLPKKTIYVIRECNAKTIDDGLFEEAFTASSPSSASSVSSSAASVTRRRRETMINGEVSNHDLILSLIDYNQDTNHSDDITRSGSLSIGKDVEFYRINSSNIDTSTSTIMTCNKKRGFKLAFSDISYCTSSGKVILEDISAFILAGEMCALMGKSGAGKTTLLDLLSQRLLVTSAEQVTGSISYDGIDSYNNINSSNNRTSYPNNNNTTISHSFFAYVPQFNVLNGSLTVLETLRYAAAFKLDEWMATSTKEERVLSIINMLGLKEVQDSLIGSMDDRGISGGQLKRVSIAIEIISLPILLYLDEPTTGLDSFTSLEVMSAVRNMTNMNQAVTLCTIHQPSTELFELFDRLLLLANGRVLYFGPTSGVIDYFMSCPWGFDYQVTSNPADFIISIATGSKTKSGSLSELLDYYKKTDLYESNKIFITNLTTAEASSSITTMMMMMMMKPKVYPVATVTTFRHQLHILLSRRLLILYKRPMFVLSHLIKMIVIALIYGTIFYQLKTGTDESCYTNRLSLFFLITTNAFLLSVPVITELFEEKALYKREVLSNSYGPYAYATSFLLIESSINVVLMFVFSLIIYSLAGLRSQHFGVLLTIVLLLSSGATTFFCLLTTITSSSSSSNMLIAPIYIWNSMFAGYLIYIPNLPVLSRWMSYIATFRYALQGLILNEFQDNVELPSSDEYLDKMGYNNDEAISIQACIGILFIAYVTCTILFFICLKYVEKYYD